MGIYINKELKIYNPELALLPELTCDLPLDTSWPDGYYMLAIWPSTVREK
jgi:hypothetical protein